MRLNPEIHRNLWLDFSLHRLIAMPVVLALIFYISTHGFDSNESAHVIALNTATGSLFFLLVKLWGGNKAAQSVIEEVNDNTWDFQRLSALTPWELTVGKLFGSTAYSWYGGLIVFIVACMCAFTQLPLYAACVYAASLLTGGMLVHAAALFTSMTAIQNRLGSHTKIRSIIYLLAGIFVGGVFSVPASLFGNPKIFAAIAYNPISWFGTDFDMVGFTTFAGFLLLLWLVAGIYWQMRSQMKMRTTPWLWIGFVLFWMIFLAGFSVREATGIKPAYRAILETESGAGVISFAVSFFCFYLIAFQEGWSIISYRRFAAAFKARHYSRAFDFCPRWVPTCLICALVVVTAPLWLAVAKTFTAMLLMFALLAFALRDVAILHFFKFAPNNRRAYQVTIFYLAVSYVLLPLLFGIMHFKVGASLVCPFSSLRGIIESGDNGPILQSLVSGLFQALFMAVLSLRRWQQYGVNVG